MSPEPEAGAPTATPTDTASSDAAALPESTAAEATAESPGGATDATPAPTPDDESVEAGAEEGTDEQRAEARTRTQRQRDKWLADLKADPAKLREALGDETLSPLVKAEVDKIEADRKSDEEAKARDARTAEAVKARQEKFAGYLGTPESNQALQNEISQLSVDLAAVTTDPDIDTDPEKIQRSKDLAASLQTKRADLARLVENNQMSDLIWEDIWSTVGDDFASAAAFPELAKDTRLQTRYLKAEGGVRGALNVLRDILQADWKAASDAEIAELKKAHKVELDAALLDAKTWRQRAGGSELDGVGAGAPSYAPGVLTPDGYSRMTSEQRQKLRSTPEGRAQIDRMVRAGAA